MSHELEAFTRRGGSCVLILVDKSRRQLSASTLTLDKSKRRWLREPLTRARETVHKSNRRRPPREEELLEKKSS
jgi:hypothetical protein